MQSGFTRDTPLLVDVVIAVEGIIEQGDAFDDELTVVGDTAADVPWMVLVEEVAFDVEHHVHRLEDDTFSSVFT